MAFLYEINDNLVEQHGNQKYWIDHSSRMKIGFARDSDFIIEIHSNGSFEYRKNRRDGTAEVLPQNGSYDWITVQILSSKPIPKLGHDVVAYYAPYVPLIHANISAVNNIVYRTRYDLPTVCG